MSRRAFLRAGAGLAVVGAAGGSLAACVSGTDSLPSVPMVGSLDEVPAGTRSGKRFVLGRTRRAWAVPSGYASIDQMLAQRPFFVAHRGGSRDWPEMSLFAYTQSVCRHVGALEVSLARSRDGVWFGLHDATLDRTSGTSHFVASEHSWADIKTHVVTAAGTSEPHQPARPYMRWEELISAYYGSHVIFVDPKHALAYGNELLDLMDQLPGRPRERLVAKYAALDPRWAKDASARGFRTWGFYSVGDAAQLSGTQRFWDMLGVDVRADAAMWAQARSYGKPVLAHVVASTADRAAAQRRGADGMIVSGVREMFGP